MERHRNFRQQQISRMMNCQRPNLLDVRKCCRGLPPADFQPARKIRNWRYNLDFISRFLCQVGRALIYKNSKIRVTRVWKQTGEGQNSQSAIHLCMTRFHLELCFKFRKISNCTLLALGAESCKRCRSICLVTEFAFHEAILCRSLSPRLAEDNRKLFTLSMLQARKARNCARWQFACSHFAWTSQHWLPHEKRAHD